MTDCVFCTDVTRSGDVIFEDARAWVVLHEDGSPRGHAMVVSKRHVENVSDLDADEWTHLTRVWQHAERAILDATKKERAIIMKLGIATPHLHVHIYPMSATASRSEVFEAIDGRRSEAKDAAFIGELRQRLTPRRD